MPRLVRILLAALLLLPAAAQAAPALTAADLRPSQSLDGAWHWSVDPYRDGVAGFHGGPPGESSKRCPGEIEHGGVSG